MIIKKSITVNRYPYTDSKSNKVVKPAPIHLDQLDVTFEDNPQYRTVYARIKGFPIPVALFGPRGYTKIQNKKSEKLFETKLLELLGNDPSVFLQSVLPKTLEIHPNGPGSILSGMLSSLGIRSAPTCSCKRRALEMNEKGPDWCEQNIDHIVGWLEQEAKRRRLPFVRTIAKIMVQRAISKSRRLLNKAKNDKT